MISRAQIGEGRNASTGAISCQWCERVSIVEAIVCTPNEISNGARIRLNRRALIKLRGVDIPIHDPTIEDVVDGRGCTDIFQCHRYFVQVGSIRARMEVVGYAETAARNSNDRKGRIGSRRKGNRRNSNAIIVVGISSFPVSRRAPPFAHTTKRRGLAFTATGENVAKTNDVGTPDTKPSG